MQYNNQLIYPNNPDNNQQAFNNQIAHYQQNQVPHPPSSASGKVQQNELQKADGYCCSNYGKNDAKVGRHIMQF